MWEWGRTRGGPLGVPRWIAVGGCISVDMRCSTSSASRCSAPAGFPKECLRPLRRGRLVPYPMYRLIGDAAGSPSRKDTGSGAEAVHGCAAEAAQDPTAFLRSQPSEHPFRRSGCNQSRRSTQPQCAGLYPAHMRDPDGGGGRESRRPPAGQEQHHRPKCKAEHRRAFHRAGWDPCQQHKAQRQKNDSAGRRKQAVRTFFHARFPRRRRIKRFLRAEPGTACRAGVGAIHPNRGRRCGVPFSLSGVRAACCLSRFLCGAGRGAECRKQRQACGGHGLCRPRKLCKSHAVPPRFCFRNDPFGAFQAGRVLCFRMQQTARICVWYANPAAGCTCRRVPFQSVSGRLICLRALLRLPHVPHDRGHDGRRHSRRCSRCTASGRCPDGGSNRRWPT